MKLSEILEALTTYTGRFPESAVRAAIEQREAITPVLLRVLEEVAEAPETYAKRGDYMLHLYALHLLAQFRDRRAFRPTLRILAAPGDPSDDLFGETLTSRMANLLASVYDGDAEPLRRLVEDEKANVWARAAAAHTFIVLVATGQMAHDEVSRYIGELFAGRLPRTSSYLWDALADVVAHLPIRELLGAVKQAFDEELSEDHPSAFKYIAKDSAMSPKERARLMAERYNLVGSAIDEMSWWAAFSADDTQTPRHAGVERQFVEQTSGGTDGSKTIWSSGRPMRSELKTGRNDPCPCGSGKKFKKCCLVAPPSPR